MTTTAVPQLESDGESEPRGETAGVIAPPPLIYLGALGVGFGLDAVIRTGSLPSAVAVPVGAASIMMVVDRGVIAREERYLERKFGRPYLDYKRRVRRWL